MASDEAKTYPLKWDRFYAADETNFEDLYSPEFKGGSGSEYADDYIGSMLGLTEAKDNPDVPVTQLIARNQEEVKATPFEDMKTRINGRASSIVAQKVQGQLDTLSQLYAETGDQRYVEDADAVAAEIDMVEQKPLGSKLAEMALEALKSDRMGDVDRAVFARQTQLAMVGEFLEGADLGWKPLLGSIIPFRNTAQFVAEGGFNSVSEYKDKIANFKAMMPEEQIAALPEIMAEIWKMSGENSFMFQDRILPFIDREDINKVYEAFAWDAVDAASILPITKVARYVKAAITPARVARNAGAKNVGGKIVAEVLEDVNGETARAAGMERVDAAASALPFNGEGAIPEIVDGLSPEAQAVIVDKLTEGRSVLNKIIYDPNLIIKRSPLTDKEIAETQKKYLEQFSGNARITESDPYGFTVEFDVLNPRHSNTLDWSEVPNRIAEIQGDIDQYQSRLSDLKATYGDEALSQEEYKYIENVLIAERKELEQLNKQLSKNMKTASSPTLTKTAKIRYTRDDVGVLDAVEYSKASAGINSPQSYINQMLDSAVEDSTIIGFSQQQLRNFFETSTQSTLGGLGGKSRKKIDAILYQGDTDKITRYSTADLMQGVATPDGLIRLDNAKEIAAYHGVRDILDTAYLMKNRQLRRELEFEKYQSVKLNVGDVPVVAFVKPALGGGGQPLKMLPEKVKKLYDFASDRVIEVGNPNIVARRVEAEGWQILKSKYPVEVGDELIEYVLAKPSNVKRLPDRVLSYRPGYVPRIYKNVFFVAEQVGKKVVNGSEVDGYRTVKRYFSGNDEAEEWANIQRGKGETIVVRPGREWLEMHPEFKQDYEAAVFGGLYSGKRADEVIPFGLKGTEAEKIGAFEAMEKAMSHVSSRLPINEWRMGMIRRFLNSAKDPITGKSLLENPGDWRSEIVGIPKTSKEYLGLKNMRDWMEDQFRIPTAEERWLSNLAARWSSAIDGKWTRGSWKVLGAEFNPRLNLLSMANKDIFASMRSFAFHSLLGWFNPAQLYVQALGASMAFSVAPHKFPILVPRYLALRAAMFSDNPEVWARTGLASGLGRNDAIEMVKAFRKSGLLDSVRSSADFDAAIRGYGISRRSFSQAADRGLIFFREGETLVRSYGWLLSHSEFIAKKPKGYKLTDKDIDAITKRSLAYTMNLNRANRAFWQKGVLSIPTQFWQITAKFIENMAYSLKGGRGKWTPGEKAKIMAGQLVMFGAAGVPFGQWAAQGVASWVGSDEEYGLAVKDPEAISAIRGGLTEFLMHIMTDDALSVSSRVSIPQGIESFIETMLRSDSTLGEKLAGAFGEVPGRFAEALNDILPIFVGYTQDMESFDGPQAVADIGMELGDIVSSWRNIHKAYMWEQAQAILDNKGTPIIPLDPEEDASLIFAKALGIEPRAIEDYYSLSRYNSLNKKDLQNVADAWIKIAVNYANSPQMGTPEGRKRVANMISFINRGLTEEQRADVAKSVINRLRKDDYRITQELLDAVENVRKTHGKTTAGYKGSLELNSLMVPNRPTDSEDAKNAQ